MPLSIDGRSTKPNAGCFFWGVSTGLGKWPEILETYGGWQEIFWFTRRHYARGYEKVACPELSQQWWTSIPSLALGLGIKTGVPGLRTAKWAIFHIENRGSCFFCCNFDPYRYMMMELGPWRWYCIYKNSPNSEDDLFSVAQTSESIGHLMYFKLSLKHNLARGVSITLTHPEKGSESFFKTESAQILRDKLCKFAKSNSHRDWFVFQKISLDLYFPIKGQQIYASTSTSQKTPPLQLLTQPTWSRKGFHMGDLREFSTNQIFNEYFLGSMWIRKSMKNMKRIWHLRWIIQIHLGKAKLERFFCCGCECRRKGTTP